MKDIWNELNSVSIISTHKLKWKTRHKVQIACEKLAIERGITGVHALKIDLFGLSPGRGSEHSTTEVSDEFVIQVKSALPPQPWKPGIHKEISNQLNCELWQFREAVDHLIEDGTFLRQRDGVLFDEDGNIVKFDPERVNPDTLELIPK